MENWCFYDHRNYKIAKFKTQSFRRWSENDFDNLDIIAVQDRKIMVDNLEMLEYDMETRMTEPEWL